MAIRGNLNIVQAQRYEINMQTVAVPSWSNNDSNYRQFGSQTWTITPKFPQSRFFIDLNCMVYGVTSHLYLTLKRGGTSGTWLHRANNSDQDGIFANHSESNAEYWNAGFRWDDRPNINNTNAIVYVPYIGMWSAKTLYVGSYSNNGNATVNNMHGFIYEVAT